VPGWPGGPRYHRRMIPVQALPFPSQLQAAGTMEETFEALVPVETLPPGTMVRVTRGDLDILVAHTEAGLVAIEDRCPHMAAPLSLGQLEGCVVRCPLHRGAFDLRDGEVVTFPTTGGLEADGASVPAWTPEGAEPRPAPSDLKAQARALTRVRRLRYLPLRVRDGLVEVVLPR
jgi:3-phenylpropionate/trans-cinnamate dioxygenase ferredoxin component